MGNFPTQRETAVTQCRNDLSSFCMANASRIEAGGNIYENAGFDLSREIAQRVAQIQEKLGEVTQAEVAIITSVQNIRFTPSIGVQDFCKRVGEKLLEKLAA